MLLINVRHVINLSSLCHLKKAGLLQAVPMRNQNIGNIKNDNQNQALVHLLRQRFERYFSHHRALMNAEQTSKNIFYVYQALVVTKTLWEVILDLSTITVASFCDT